MQEEQNTKVVQAGYAAFGSGNIPALLALLDDSVSWEGTHGASPKIPTAGVKHGKTGVGQFFRDLAENETFQSFEPRKFVAQGDTVVCLGHFESTHNKTQKKVVITYLTQVEEGIVGAVAAGTLGGYLIGHPIKGEEKTVYVDKPVPVPCPITEQKNGPATARGGHDATAHSGSNDTNTSIPSKAPDKSRD